MYHILIVDDNAAICDLFGMIFELNNYCASIANNALTALEISRNHSIDGIVTDFRMPDMSGFELIQKLRERQPDLPAIIVSGFAGEALSIPQHIPVYAKPVKALALVHRMNDLLRDVETARSMRSFKQSHELQDENSQ